jgi:protein involved in polysaccharide export with SLBB domain
VKRIRKLVLLVLVLVVVSLSATTTPAQRGGARTGRDQVQKDEPTESVLEQKLLLDSQPQTDQRLPTGLDEPIDPDTYIIGPFDQFVVVLRGQMQKEILLQVLPEGSVMLPNYGAFRAAGFTITQFREELRALLDKYYKHVEFDCQLIQPRSFVVYVLGEVERPGAVVLTAPFRVGTAIHNAGGIKDKGTLRYIHILEKGDTVQTVDLFSFLRLGQASNNISLKEGQSVYVPAKQRTVYIFGEVWNSGRYELRDGDTIADLIRFAGGGLSYADYDRIVLERNDKSGQVVIEHFNSTQIDTVLLKAEDRVIVPDARMYTGGKFVQIRGGGGREGKVYIEDGETIGSFAPRFIRLTEDHDASRTVIEREDEDGTVDYIRVDLQKVLSGEADGDIPLKNGDIISIPQTDDFVYVAGEVTAPGEIEFQRGLPAERYIALAGGPTRAGSINKLTIFSRDGTSRKGKRDSAVYRGDTILVERTTASYVGPIFVGLTSLTSLILSVIAVSK